MLTNVLNAEVRYQEVKRKTSKQVVNSSESTRNNVKPKDRVYNNNSDIGEITITHDAKFRKDISINMTNEKFRDAIKKKYDVRAMTTKNIKEDGAKLWIEINDINYSYFIPDVNIDTVINDIQNSYRQEKRNARSSKDFEGAKAFIEDNMKVDLETMKINLPYTRPGSFFSFDA